MSVDTDCASIFSKRQVPLNGRTFRDFDSVSFDSLKKHPMQLAKLLSSLQNSKWGISLHENHLEATFPCSQAIEIPNSFFSKNLPHYLSTPRLHPYLSDCWEPCWCSHSQPDSPWPRTTSTDALARNSAPWLCCKSLHGDGTTSCDLASHSSILLYLLSSLIQVLSLPLQMAAPCKLGYYSNNHVWLICIMAQASLMCLDVPRSGLAHRWSTASLAVVRSQFFPSTCIKVHPATEQGFMLPTLPPSVFVPA